MSTPHNINDICEIVYPIMDQHENISLRGMLRIVKTEHGTTPSTTGAYSRAYNRYLRGDRLVG